MSRAAEPRTHRWPAHAPSRRRWRRERRSLSVSGVAKIGMNRTSTAIFAPSSSQGLILGSGLRQRFPRFPGAHAADKRGIIPERVAPDHGRSQRGRYPHGRPRRHDGEHPVRVVRFGHVKPTDERGRSDGSDRRPIERRRQPAQPPSLLDVLPVIDPVPSFRAGVDVASGRAQSHATAGPNESTAFERRLAPGVLDYRRSNRARKPDRAPGSLPQVRQVSIQIQRLGIRERLAIADSPCRESRGARQSRQSSRSWCVGCRQPG